MKQKLIFGAMAALMLSACSQDEVININNDAINYSVTAGSVTRAADSYCNNVLPESFKIWAQNTDDNNLYIDGDVIANLGGNPTAWGNTGGERYWPENSLNFFAEVNGDAWFNWNNGTPKFENFTVEDDVTRQRDLMYAVKLNQSKAGGKVNLNFRHALSQVAFKAKNTNAKLYVEVSGVSVGHIGSQGTFTYAVANTDQNWEDTDHNDLPHDVTLPGQGSWTDAQLSTLKQYDVTFDAKPLTANVTNLTAPEENHKNGFTNVLTLLPQTVQAWDPSKKGSEFNGAYFLVKCKICNIAGSQYNADTDKVLYDGYTAIPVDINWEQGKRYIYTFNFSNGTGGYTPNPDDPKPTLNGIEWDVTVDDFVPVGGDINMDGKDDNVDPEEKYDYTVIYDYNDGTDRRETDVDYNRPSPHTWTVEADDPSREGYTFQGWSTTANGAAQYNYGSQFTMTKDNNELTLYAVWKKNVEYVTFRINFLDNNPSTKGLIVTGMPSPAYLEAKVEKGTQEYTFTLPANTPAIGNWKFMGWSPLVKTYADDPKWAPGSTYTVTADKPVVDLYAVWGTRFTGGSTPGAGGTDYPTNN